MDNRGKLDLLDKLDKLDKIQRFWKVQLVQNVQYVQIVQSFLKCDGEFRSLPCHNYLRTFYEIRKRKKRV